MQEVLNEIVEKVASLTGEEKRELLQLLQEEEKKLNKRAGKIRVRISNGLKRTGTSMPEIMLLCMRAN